MLPPGITVSKAHSAGRVMAIPKSIQAAVVEITLSHLLRLTNEQVSHVSREQALAFLNQEGRAFELDCETHF